MNLARLEAEGVFSVLDVELARGLCRLADERDEALALAVALTSREVQRGNACADLSQLAGTPLGEEPGARLPALDDWLRRLERSALVVRVDASGMPARAKDDAGPAPLVLDDQNRLYLARYYEHERELGQLLLTLHADVGRGARDDDALVRRLFPAQGPDLQRDAALAARARRFSVIVGGPGTGKTSTVVKLLALLVSDALAAGRSAPRCLLVAPTGKAAQRLTQAIESARDKLPIEPALRDAIPSNALTLHRALGPLAGSLTRFRHGPERPLDADLVLLDEASMVDLALMRRFLSAVPPHARVIMLGDPDQLASVEAGGVLSDLCRAAERGPFADAVSRLKVSYRYPEDSGIYALASAVHAQSFDDALAVLRAGRSDVSFHATPRPHELGRALERDAREHYAQLSHEEDELRLAALDHYRVLCAHRSGPASVEQLNPLLSRTLGPGRGANYPGRPVIVTQNDYATQLFNGDTGVLVRQPESRRRDLVAAFRGAKGVRRVPLARLPSHESAYAMTVHKSQGSEFDRVAIVLPERPSQLLSRELLYTAITRAKRSVSLYASEASLRAALSRSSERSTGLVDRLTR